MASILDNTPITPMSRGLAAFLLSNDKNTDLESSRVSTKEISHMPRIGKNVEMTRLNFDGVGLRVPKTTRERMETLRDEAEAESLSEVVRRALSLYEQLLRAFKQGDEIIVRRGDGTEQRVLLA